MTFSLRLTEEMHRAARERAARIGITLNALVCVALDQYLRDPVYEVSHPAPTKKGVPVAPGSQRCTSLGSGAPSPLPVAENAPEALSEPSGKLWNGYPESELWQWIERQDQGQKVPKLMRQIVHQYRQHLGV